jgi:hypothetical protein
VSSEDFDELFGGKKKTTTIKKQPSEVDQTTEIQYQTPTPVRKTPIRLPKTTKLDIEKLSEDIISSLSKKLTEAVDYKVQKSMAQHTQPQAVEIHPPDVIQGLKKIIEEQSTLIGAQDVKLKHLERASIHIFNESNALFYSMFNIRTGYKPKGMWEFFMTTDGAVTEDQIKDMDQYFQDNEFVKQNRNGWRRLTEKGRKRLEELTLEKD